MMFRGYISTVSAPQCKSRKSAQIKAIVFFVERIKFVFLFVELVEEV
jgi:hypothetical protein